MGLKHAHHCSWVMHEFLLPVRTSWTPCHGYSLKGGIREHLSVIVCFEGRKGGREREIDIEEEEEIDIESPIGITSP